MTETDPSGRHEGQAGLPMLCRACGRENRVGKPLFQCVSCSALYHSSCHRPFPQTRKDWTCRNCVLQPKKYAPGRRYHDTAKVPAAVSLRSSVSSSLGPNSPTISTGTTGSPVDSSSTLICNFPGCSKLMIPPSRWCPRHRDIVRNFDLSRSPHLLPNEPPPADRAEHPVSQTIEQAPPMNGMESLSEPGNSSEPKIWTETLKKPMAEKSDQDGSYPPLPAPRHSLSSERGDVPTSCTSWAFPKSASPYGESPDAYEAASGSLSLDLPHEPPYKRQRLTQMSGNQRQSAPENPGPKRSLRDKPQVSPFVWESSSGSSSDSEDPREDRAHKKNFKLEGLKKAATPRKQEPALGLVFNGGALTPQPNKYMSSQARSSETGNQSAPIDQQFLGLEYGRHRTDVSKAPELSGTHTLHDEHSLTGAGEYWHRPSGTSQGSEAARLVSDNAIMNPRSASISQAERVNNRTWEHPRHSSAGGSYQMNQIRHRAFTEIDVGEAEEDIAMPDHDETEGTLEFDTLPGGRRVIGRSFVETRGDQKAPSAKKDAGRAADEARFDAIIYGNQGAAAPPPGVRISALECETMPLAKKAADQLLYLHIDPRVHWNQPKSEAWYKAKMDEIAKRPRRKQNFGRAAQRMAEQRLKKTGAQLEQEWEESLPPSIRDNPQWLRALKQLEGRDTGGKDRDENVDDEDEDETDLTGLAAQKRRRRKRPERKPRKAVEAER